MQATSGAIPIGDCLLEDELLEYQAGRCSEVQLTRLDAHLDSCTSCRELVHYVLGSEKPGDVDEAAEGNGWLTTFTPGSVVASRYLIRRFVGKGGMGEVYEAFDRLMAMKVALKTVLCTASDRPHAVHKLMDEVKNALRVGHPNVCRINELQEHHDAQSPSAAVPFFTMEFVEGERLGHRLEHGPLPLADARSIAHQLLDGLDAAHARGVLHLDFKSDNVMLRRGTSPPEAVIMDFGLSRTLDRPSRPPHERHELAGTLPYMSVEQLESDAALGPATDVYSFGVVLYEMLTGRLPFSGNTSSAMLLEQLQRRPPPPSHYAATLSRALDHFVLRCLDNDPSHRFSNAGAALDALETIDDWQRQPEPRARLWCLLAVAAACALVLAAALDLSSQREPTPTVVLQPLEAAPHAPLAPPTPELPKHPPSLPDALAQPAELPPPLAPAHRPARDDATRAATTRHPAPLPLATATALAGASVPPKPPSARFPDSTTARPNPLEAARATNDINDDWTPRALPRSLLVPTRRDTSVR